MNHYEREFNHSLQSLEEINLPNPKRIEYLRKYEEEVNLYNPTLTGFLGPYFVPLVLVSAGYFVLSYLYRQFTPLDEILPADDCYLILTQVRKAWGVAITESSRQETKLLEDYSHLTIDQQSHLLDVLRQTLIADLEITEEQICKLYHTTKHQVKQSVEFYTRPELKQLSTNTPPQSNATNNSNDINQQQSLEQQQKQELLDYQRLLALKNEIIKFVQLVLPQPELPLGWSTEESIELLSQWFELRIVVMEKTFNHLVFHNDKFTKIQPLISPVTGRPTTRIKLTQEQVDILNESYTKNVEVQINTFCTQRGVTYPFLLQLNRCVMHTDDFAQLTVRYKEEQMKRLIILGIEVASGVKRG